MLSMLAKNHRVNAIQDIFAGVYQVSMWWTLAWQKVRQRYRRSMIGPLWLSMSMAVQMATMGVLVTFLFNHEFGRYLPYLCLGLIIWNFFSASLNTGATIFIEHANFILSVKRPLFIYVLSHVCKSSIESLHNFLVYLVIAIIFFVVPGSNTFWLLLTIPLCMLNITWITFSIAIIATRYRDIPMIVQSIMGVMFWLTPIIYFPDQLGDKAIILYANPLYHLMDIIRLPILNTAPMLSSLIVCGVMAIIGWLMTIELFSRYRNKIPLWL